MAKAIVTLVDELGELRAKIAALREEETKVEEAIKSHGAGAYDGELFRANVIVADRATTAWKAVAEHLSPSRQLVTAHTTVSTVTSIKVTARLTAKAA